MINNIVKDSRSLVPLEDMMARLDINEGPRGDCSKLAERTLALIADGSKHTYIGFDRSVRNIVAIRCQLMIDGHFFTDTYRVLGQINREMLRNIIKVSFNDRPAVYSILAAFRLQFVSCDEDIKGLGELEVMDNPGGIDFTGLPGWMLRSEDMIKYNNLNMAPSPFHFHQDPQNAVDASEIEQSLQLIE